MYACLRFFLFLLPPETAHHLSLPLIRWAYGCSIFRSVFCSSLPKAPIELAGLQLPNPIGLAAGLDKDGICLDAWFAMGFGFVEVGTVTPRPQSGNPKPRLFRLRQDEALINRMGFNNMGVNALVERIKQRRIPGILGVNIGKNLTTPLDRAVQDYRYCLTQIYPYADYVTINVSSPNTPGLRKLQTEAYLEALLVTMSETRNELAQVWNRRLPLFVKVSPDLNEDNIKTMSKIFKKQGIDAVIATNTSISRTQLKSKQWVAEQGGLSGRPLLPIASQVVRLFASALGSEIPVIAVGGLSDVQDALAMKKAGAKACQVYTGLIYQGPNLIRHLIEGFF